MRSILNKAFRISHFYTKWIALCLVSLLSTPTITTDGWVIGSLQSRSRPPFQHSYCSHPDLSGQPVFGTFLGCFCHKMILMAHSSYLWCNLRLQSMLVYTSGSLHTREKHKVASHTGCFFLIIRRVRRCRKEAEEKERRESLSVLLWASIFSKNSNLQLLITCCKAVRPQGSLDACSESSKWPECTE